MDLKGKVAIVTGGANGIGLCIARILLENGASVAILDQNREKGKEATKQLQEKYGTGKVNFFKCNVVLKEEFQGAVKEAVDKFSKIDIFVNNAGIGPYPRWEYIVEVNLMGVMRGVEEATKYMSKESGGNGGVIVNIASITGLTPFPVSATYAASKYGVIGFTKSLGFPELYEASGIRHIAICPGFTMTDLTKEATEEYTMVMEQLMNMKIVWQKPEVVAACFVEALKNATTGSVWVVENGEPGYEISIPDYKIFKVDSG